MNCQEVIELMHRQLDGDLDEQEHQLLLKHTRQCPDCAAMFERLKKLSSELENLPRVMPSYSLVDAIMPQLEQLESHRISEAASMETSEVNPGSRSAAPRRRKPGWRMWSGAIAASVVAGMFIVSYNAGLFENSSSDKMGLSNTVADSATADSNKSLSREVKKYAFDEHAGEVNVESFNHEAANAPASKENPIPVYPQKDDTQKIFTGGVIDRSEGNSSSDGGGTGDAAGSEQGQKPEGLAPDSPALLTAASADGVYVAQSSGFVVRISKADEVVFETPRKNGQISKMTWSEDNNQLTYEIQLDQGGMERYVVDVAQLKETKADH
ncbi:anti-sigma factor family protein [Paenibacillus gorillae]|uniref:anti-sigma factor family protein n=1 Tax=Paenibacillus gorillae TaxID=1243662 RepID=UPI0004BC7054|nr:zf-HC2 domain-containing protein [Paenibacillus gorillae]